MDDYTPYIEEPEIKAVGDGSCCWLSPDRICGCDCIAFNTENGNEGGPNQCLILLYMGQLGSGVVGVSRLMSRVQQDQLRAAGSAVPEGL
jgi:hypothetical protein